MSVHYLQKGTISPKKIWTVFYEPLQMCFPVAVIAVIKCAHYTCAHHLRCVVDKMQINDSLIAFE
jgi:hypothetical protein